MENRVIFEGSEIYNLTRPCVYIFWRGSTALYVGASNNGIARPFAPRHSARRSIGFNADRLEVRFTSKPFDEERRLILELKPALNKVSAAL